MAHHTDPASKALPVANYMLTNDKEHVDKKAKAAMGKAIKQAQNQAKMTKALEKNSILKTEKDKLQDDMDELLKRIADNEPCD